MTEHDPARAVARPILDKLAGKTKEIAGAVLGNDDLAEEGALQARKADVADEATRLTREAEQREAEAELHARQAENVVERERVAADLAARTREAQVEREAAAARAHVERTAAEQAAANERRLETEEQIIDINESEVVVDLADDASNAARAELEARRAEAAAESLAAAQRNLADQ